MINLNKSLYLECTKKELDYVKIKELLDKGADPLGCYNKFGDIVYNELIYDAMDNNKKIYKITAFFLKNGMKIENKKLIRKYGNEVINPLWSLAFMCNNDSVQTLKLFLDNNLELESVEIFIDHLFTDNIFLEDDFETIKKNKKYFRYFEHVMKSFMLCASYSYIIEKSDYLRNIVEIENNNYDITKFINYKDYYVTLDIEEDNKITVRFFNKKTSKIVWKLNKLKK